MRYKIQIIGVLITIMCILFGIMIPSVMFSIQDKKMVSKDEMYSIDETHFKYASTLFDVMKNINNSLYEVECADNAAQLSTKEAENIAVDFLDNLDLEKWGIEEGTVDRFHVISSVSNIALMSDRTVNFDTKIVDKALGYDTKAVDKSSKGSVAYAGDNNEHFASIIWYISIKYNGEVSMEVVVDDKNKKVISFIIYLDELDGNHIEMSSADETDGNDIEMSSENKLNVEYVNNILIPYLNKYYDVDIETIYGEDGLFFLKLKDKEDNNIIVNLNIQSVCFSFNN